jgi:cytochrome c5
MSRVHSVCTRRHGPSRSGAPMAQGAPGAVGLQSLPAKAGEGEEAMPIRGSAGVTP